jgi:hypothetical protein
VSYTWTGINNAYLNPGKRKEKQKRKKKIEKKNGSREDLGLRRSQRFPNGIC